MKLNELAAVFTSDTPVEVWGADEKGLFLTFDGIAGELAGDEREIARTCITEGALAIRLRGAEATAEDAADLRLLGYSFFEV